MTEVGEIGGVECTVGMSELKQVFFFTVLISGWPVVFVSPKREVVSWGRKWLLSQCIAAVSYEVIVRMPCVHACTRRARGRGVHLS